MAAELLVDRHGSTRVLTFSNPGFRNALGPAMYAACMAAFDDVASDASIRTVILTGADGMFSAGGDLNRLLENRGQPPQVQADAIDNLHRMTRAITACTRPVIAAVEGYAAGAGMSLALACDMITAGTSARFVMAYAKVGLSPDGGGSWFATHGLPRQTAAEMMLEGGAWPAARLHALGVVNTLVDDGKALDAAFQHAERLAALSPHALGRIKQLMGKAVRASLEQHLLDERESFVACLHHPDGGEAIAAFLAKRAARFD